MSETGSVEIQEVSKDIQSEKNQTSDHQASTKRKKEFTSRSKLEESDDEDDMVDDSTQNIQIVIPDSLKILYDDGKFFAVSKPTGFYFESLIS
jgi:23S rRNA-/tRNA-specific pseudouridylate synthase